MLSQSSVHALERYFTFQAFLAVGATWIVYIVARRLFLHPLKSFPGPRLAAITDLYSAYYEIWMDGRIVSHLEELHRMYGPVIRIRPNELHFSTPAAYFAIYPPYSGFTKEPKFYGSFGADDSSFSFLRPQDHKARRDLLNPLFSRRAIIKFEHVIQDTVERFIDRLWEYDNKPVSFRLGFRAVTMDVITTYCFGCSFGGVSAPRFDHPILASLDASIPVLAVSRYLPILRSIQNLPPNILGKLHPSLAGYASMQNSLRVNIEKYLANPSTLRKAEHETIYHHLLPEGVEPSRWPSKRSLLGESLTLFGAGTDTTSNALSLGLYQLLLEENAPALKRLEDELKEAWPEKESPFSYQQAEKLPYLTSVIKESVRLSIGAGVPLPRVVQSPVVIDGFFVPAGAVVGCSPKFINMNPDVFPEPNRFVPERWLQSNSAELDKHMVAFSRGPRSCIGLTLAWCEMYIVFSHLLRKFEIKLHDTKAEDMDLREYALASWRGKGLSATVKERSR